MKKILLLVLILSALMCATAFAATYPYDIVSSGAYLAKDDTIILPTDVSVAYYYNGIYDATYTDAIPIGVNADVIGVDRTSIPNVIYAKSHACSYVDRYSVIDDDKHSHISICVCGSTDYGSYYEDYHDFDIYGECKKCNYACPHPSDVRREYTYSNITSTQHTVNVVCLKCGGIVTSQSGTFAHSFIGNECVCGYVRGAIHCTHPTGVRTFVKSDATYHYYRDNCGECGVLLEQGKEKHSFKNGVCEFCGYKKGSTPKPSYDHTAHWIRKWTATGRNTHKGNCSYDGCDFKMVAACDYIMLDDETQVCPLCGAAKGEKKETLPLISIFADDVENNDITIRGNKNYITICEDYCGKLQELHEMTITLPLTYSGKTLLQDGEELEGEVTKNGLIVEVTPVEGTSVVVIDVVE